MASAKSQGRQSIIRWTAELFGLQVDDLLDCFDCLHPDWQLCLEVSPPEENTHATHTPHVTRLSTTSQPTMCMHALRRKTFPHRLIGR